jgi:hypothetical protein
MGEGEGVQRFRLCQPRFSNKQNIKQNKTLHEKKSLDEHHEVIIAHTMPPR